MKRKFFTAMLCLLLVTVTVLASCDGSAGNTDATGENTKNTTAKNTAATTVATTAGETVDPMPTKLEPVIKQTNINKVISHLVEEPITVEIYNGVTIDLNYHGWPTICKGDGDTIYAAVSLRITHIDIFGALGFTKSTDGGKTWEPMRIIKDTPLDDRDCGLTYLGNGHLMISWFTHPASWYHEDGHYNAYYQKLTAEQKDAVNARFDSLTLQEEQDGSYVMHSLDGGETWGDPIAIPVSCPHGATLAQDGKTLLYLGAKKGALGASLRDDAFTLYTSVDGGYTWTIRSEISKPTQYRNNSYEAYVMQLKDGTYLAAFRIDDPTVAWQNIQTLIVRSNNGTRWSTPVLLEGATGAPPHLLQLSNGAVLLTYACRNKGECSIRACISYDGGKTWDPEFVIAYALDRDNGDHGYPSTVELEDGTLITAYYQAYRGASVPSMLYTKWTLKPVDAEA